MIDPVLLLILLGIVAICGLILTIIWPPPRHKPLGEKRKWLERHTLSTMRPKERR